MGLLFLYLPLLCQCLTWHFGLANFNLDSQDGKISLLMPNITTKGQEYICASFDVQNLSLSVTAIHPQVNREFAHHVSLFGCGVPVSMEKSFRCTVSCPVHQRFMYGWTVHSSHSQDFTLPSGMGMRIGKGTHIKYLILAVHYEVRKEGQEIQDNSGMIVTYTKRSLPMNVGVFFTTKNGGISDEMLPGTTAHAEAACEIRTNGVLHPIYFNGHTHSLGKVASGWKVDQNNTWTLLAKSDPKGHDIVFIQDPQLTLTNGDTLATSCTLVNNRTVSVEMGGMETDEMCDIYIGYWTSADTIVENTTCRNSGIWSWANNTNLKNIPDDA